jgi:hypothetical protein
MKRICFPIATPTLRKNFELKKSDVFPHPKLDYETENQRKREAVLRDN